MLAHNSEVLPDCIRLTLALLQAECDVSANQVAGVYQRCTAASPSLDECTSPTTSTRCLIEASECLLDLFVLSEINGESDLVLGLDGTSTYFGRAMSFTSLAPHPLS